jgi:hypothetical protein
MNPFKFIRVDSALDIEREVNKSINEGYVLIAPVQVSNSGVNRWPHFNASLIHKDYIGATYALPSFDNGFRMVTIPE